MRPRSALLLACFALTALAQASDTMWVKGPRTDSIPLGITTDNKLYLKARVNGRELMLFVDTGAGTILDSNLIATLHAEVAAGRDSFGIAGEAIKQQTGKVTLKLGEMEISGFPVVFLDMTATRKLHADHGLPEIDGVLGGDALRTLRARVDYDEKVLLVRRPKGN